MKNKYLFFIIIFGLNILSTTAQNTIDIKLSETSLNNALKVITNAKGINFGSYNSQYGLNAWYLNLKSATIDIKPNNKVILQNLKLEGGVDLNIWICSLTPTGEITGTISGDFDIKIDPVSQEHLLHIVPTINNYYYSGTLEGVVNLVLFLMRTPINNFIPDIEISLGTNFLPDRLARYFKYGSPLMSTTENEIIMTFETLFDEIKLKNYIIKQNNNRTYTASDLITMQAGFKAEAGSQFRAYISQKDLNSFSIQTTDNSSDLISYEETYGINNETFFIDNNENTIAEEKNIIIENSNDINIFPNPFSEKITIESPESEIILSISIYDAQGKLVYENKNVKASDELDLSHLNDGTYVLHYSYEKVTNSKQMIKIY